MIERTRPFDATEFVVDRLKKAEAELVRYNPEKLSPQLRELCDKIAELTGSWNPVEMYTPSATSATAEKKKFLDAFDAGEDYLPSFTYDVAKKMAYKRKQKKLKALYAEAVSYIPQDDQEELFRVALVYKLHDDILTCRLLKGIQTKDEGVIKHALQGKYPQPDLSLLRVAHQEYERLTQPGPEPERLPALLTPEQQKLLEDPEKKYNADQIQVAFEWVLSKYGILRTDSHSQGFSVEISNRATKVDVRDKSDKPMTIYIPKDLEVTGKNLLRLMIHEIEGHARQSMNGLEMLILGGGPLRFDNEALYEGLAMRMEAFFYRQFFGISEEASPPWSPPFDILIMEKAANKGTSFVELFKMSFEQRLRTIFKIPEGQPLIYDEKSDENKKKIQKAKEDTWSVVYKNMRGHVDMSNPEGFANPKDAAYLSGYLNDLRLRQTGFSEFNEMGIVPNGGLELMAKLGISNKNIPHQFKNFTAEYCMNVLLPQLEQKN